MGNMENSLPYLSTHWRNMEWTYFMNNEFKSKKLSHKTDQEYSDTVSFYEAHSTLSVLEQVL